ncbi:Utp14 protein-domain-containing protein [Coniella lustricola]|uniref:Utp14 protein-domain-containing protein n=1 Tax=Coniella lustricola TaxID=2025994 RepID=A0A2T2ZT10_9PEZI|nr:Utp14 protein-domain-containing protein [Coniella lustricola]
MPGRQSHGRSLMGSGPKSNKPKQQKSKTKSRAHALDAFAIAAKQLEPERVSRRGRDLGLDPERESRGGGGGGKHRRDDDDDEDGDSDEDEDEGPQKKRARQSAFGDDEDDDQSGGGEGGSDSEGNEWHVGVNADDDDSELDSDEAFGESDDEKFEGYTFRGSKSQKDAKNGDDDADDDDDESLGSDAIDLADALDQSSGSEDEDDEGSAGDTESGSEEDSEEDSEQDESEDETDPSKVGELRNLIKGFAETNKNDDADAVPSMKQTISLDDLGLASVKDPLIKKSVKLMKKEDKSDATKKSSSKRLDVPLPRRQQDQLLRAAAYEKTNETLDRWNDTVKHNRRADHLMFPLAHTLHDAGLDNSELLPLTKKTAGTELEQTILSIMEESGLGATAASNKKAEQKADDENEEQTISRADLKDLWAQRRKDRELQSREQSRAKRIKKIKSKTYRRIHRKERLGDEAAELEVMRENGEIDSEEEREAAHRRRALERVGARHKESKWAKMGSKAGRAAWDDDYRAGLTDMARRNEELRKRVEGETTRGSDDDDESDFDGSEDEEAGNARLLRQLDAADGAESDGDHPHSNLMKLAFMQRAEAQRKQLNDDMAAQLRRDLEDPDGDREEEEDDDTEAQVGRRTFGAGQDKKTPKAVTKASAPPAGALSNGSKTKSSAYTAAVEPVETASVPGAAGSWAKAGKSAVDERKKGRKSASRAEVAELDLTGAEPLALAVKASAAQKPAKTKKASKDSTNGVSALAEEGDSSDDEIHLPLALRDHELVSRAFGGEDVVAEFEAEKEAIMSDDDEKMIDNTMPGWGSWTGDGVSKRAQKRNKGKVMTKKEGIKKKDRKDAKLQKVILNEKRIRKNEKYLASQLPHPFESRQQYERSLRLPVGPEWMTKESFQQATKPRVIVKQGIIAPMAKPII